MLTTLKIVLDLGVMFGAALYLFPKLANATLGFTGYYTPRSRFRTKREKLISFSLVMMVLAGTVTVSTWAVVKSDAAIDSFKTKTTNSNAEKR